MIQRTFPVGLASLLCLALGFLQSQPAQGCPFCEAPTLTLSEQLAQSDALVLVEWVRGVEPTESQAGSTQFRVKEVAKGESVKVGDRITVPRYRAAKPGTTFMLLGSRAAELEWGSPIEVSQAAFDYVKASPPVDVPARERLTYYLKYFESPDSFIANDAYAEFAKAPYQDIKPLADALPSEKLRKWIVDPNTPATRLGLYGLLLGLSGTAEDAQVMKAKITEVDGEDFRLGIDGVMSGYLLITGDKGLKVIEDTKLAPEYLRDAEGEPVLDEKGQKRPVPFSETYAAMQSLRFMWTYGDGRIPAARLRQSMRILLDRPELADLVIADLARWKDWGVQDRLMDMYGAEEFDIPSIKRAIVRYMHYCAKDLPEDVSSGDASAELPPHVVEARSNLAVLEERDPKTVKEAIRFLLP